MADELNTRAAARGAASAPHSGEHAIRAPGLVTKRATTDRAALLREVAWLQRLPEELRAHFPRVLALRVGSDFAEYDMPQCDFANFGKLLAQDLITAPDAVAGTHRVLQFLFDRVYPRDARSTPAGFFELYLDAVEDGLRLVLGISRRFDRLVRAPALFVNGQSVDNPRRIVQSIRSDAALLARLSPPRLGLTHGNLRFDNFLIDLRSGDFVLLDPRGVTFSGESAGDYLEDVARLRASTLGLYDLVRASRMQLRVDDTRVSCECARVAPLAARTLAAIDAALLRWLPAWADARGDRAALLRLRVLTPLLLISDAAGALAGDVGSEPVAIALYATGASLLQAALDAYAEECVVDRPGF